MVMPPVLERPVSGVTSTHGFGTAAAVTSTRTSLMIGVASYCARRGESLACQTALLPCFAYASSAWEWA